MILALSILWTNSRLRLVGHTLVSDYLLFLGSLILAIPNMVLSVGCFLLFISMTDVPGFIFVLVVVSNALLALPFILRNLATPLADLTKRYQYLALSLNITGLNYLNVVEFRALKQLFTYSFAFACVISVGDFGIIALFGSQDFMTLPYYLFELVSHYRYQEASFSALILLITSYLLINSFERTP
jgi:ABC-type Fe3+ transport system, permease component